MSNTNETDLMTASFSRRDFLGGGLSLGALAGLGVTFPLGTGTARAQVKDGILHVHGAADISNLDPAFWTSAADAVVIGCIFAHAFEFDTSSSEFKPVPVAMKSVEAKDDTHIAFELNPGILYSDGYGEMTAEDAKFSFERIANPETKSLFVDDWAQLDHVEVTGKYTGVIVLKSPFVPLFTSTLPGVSGCILPKAAFDAAGGQFTTKPPCTSGPYRIKEWQPKTRLVLEKNPDWKLYEVDFDEIHLFPIEDPKSAELGFEAGDLDHVDTGISSIPRYETTAPEDGVFRKHAGLNYSWLGMNEEHPLLADQRVRRAIQHAVDRTAVVDAAYLGGSDTAAGIVAPGLVGHRAENLYNHDPEKARALLEEAGVADTLQLTLAIQQTAEYLAAAQVIQANLAAVGITVQIDQHESGTFWSLGVEADGDAWKDLQLFHFGFTMQPDPSWATVWFTPEQVGIWNWQRFNNPEFGELHKKASTEMDMDKRGAMYVRMQDLMEESGDFVFLNFIPIGTLTRKSVEPGLRPDGIPVLPRFRKA